jgi:hypothetical protein
MNYQQHKEFYQAEIMPGPLEPLTEARSKTTQDRVSESKYRSISMQDSSENKKKARDWYAMYCPECHEWNGEPGEYPGWCNYCGAELKVRVEPW